MAVFFKEMKHGFKGFCIWAGSIAFMLVVCVLMFPEMKNEMNNVSEIFANMGGFTQAFGMDRLNFGTLIGFYGVECGNILGIGGGFFVAYLGVTMLSKEEKEHTAEFLLTHPVSRFSIVLQKLCSVAVQIVAMNVAIVMLSGISIIAIGEKIPMKELCLIHTAYLLLQLEIGGICFGLSAFLRRGSIGIGLGTAAMLYFANLICNISDLAEFLKYITPFAYSEPADIVSDGSLNGLLLLLGFVYATAAIVIGFIKYVRKDIAA